MKPRQNQASRQHHEWLVCRRSVTVPTPVPWLQSDPAMPGNRPGPAPPRWKQKAAATQRIWHRRIWHRRLWHRISRPPCAQGDDRSIVWYPHRTFFSPATPCKAHIKQRRAAQMQTRVERKHAYKTHKHKNRSHTKGTFFHFMDNISKYVRSIFEK